MTETLSEGPESEEEIERIVQVVRPDYGNLTRLEIAALLNTDQGDRIPLELSPKSHSILLNIGALALNTFPELH